MHLKRGGSDKAFVTNAIANLHHHHWSYLSIQFRLRWYSHGLKLMRHYRLRNSRESYDGNQVKFCRSQMHLKFCNRTRWRRVASRRVGWEPRKKNLHTNVLTLILISHSYSNRIRINPSRIRISWPTLIVSWRESKHIMIIDSRSDLPWYDSLPCRKVHLKCHLRCTFLATCSIAEFEMHLRSTKFYLVPIARLPRIS